MDNHDPFFGVIADRSAETDYQLGGELKVPRAKFKFADNKIQYNQKEVSPVSCTIHGAIGAYSDLTGEVFTLEARKALWAEALTLGANPKVGWYINSAVDLVRHYVEANGRQKVISFGVTVGSEEFFTALALGYSVVAGYSGNQEYINDKGIDGILDGLKFGVPTYAHCIRISYSVGDEYELVVDNYVGKDPKRNSYKVKSANFKTLVANGVFFKSGYIFVLKDEYDAATNGETASIPVWATVSWTKAVKKGVVKGSDNPLKIVMDKDIEAMLVKTGVFTKSEDGVSLARWIVALDRMKLLD